MKVCIVTTAFPRWENDSRAPFILEAAKAVARQGVEVKVIASHSPGAKTHEFIDGIEIYRPRYLPIKWENLHKEPGGIPEAWKTQRFGKYAIFPFVLSQLIAVFKYSIDCDIIHANWTIAGFCVWVNKLLFGKPYVITLHGSDIYKAAKNQITKRLTKKIIDSSEKLITPSLALYNEVTNVIGYKKNNVVISNGVNINFFLPGSNHREKIVTYTGSLIKRKGVEYLIEAMSSVLESNPETKLKIIGEGNDKDFLINLVKSKSLQNSIEFLGQVSQEDVRSCLQKSKLFVLPSIEEGQGVVLIEALACGTPCVASNVGGIPEVINSDVGTLVPPQNPKALSKAIIYYLENTVIWSLKSKNARARVINNYDWNVIGERILQTYETII